MNYLSIVLEQIEIFAVYVLIGVIAVKSHVLDRERLGVVSSCVTKILLPLLIFANTINGTTRGQFFSSSIIIVIAAALYLALYLVAGALARATALGGSRQKIYHACSMFGNCGFMGIPIITALYPEQGGLYIALYTVVDQLALWTVGMDLTTPAEEGTAVQLQQRLRKMVNPATVAVVLGVVCVLTGVRLPDAVSGALTKTGAAASPLAMIYLGGVFCFIPIGDYLRKKEIYLSVLVKMVLAPLAVRTVLGHIPGVPLEIAVTVSILCALPCMSSLAMMAQDQHSDSDYAAGMILITTLASVVTIPLVCSLL